MVKKCFAYDQMDLPQHLIDTTTLIPNHSVYTHYGCVALRCLLGLYLITRYGGKRVEFASFLAVLGTALALFLYKSIFAKKTLKLYSRTVLKLTLTLILLLFAEKDAAKLVGGTLLIVDAMMGLQSRVTATLLKH